MPELYVTNFNRNFTGVSATAANVVRQQMLHHNLALVGYPLPGVSAPVTKSAAKAQSRHLAEGHDFAIWHVRRNPEMRTAIWARDVLRLPIKIVFTSAAQRRHSAFPRWLIGKMDAVIATTDRAADFVPHVRGVVPHGVDTELFAPAANRSSAWVSQGFGGTLGIATIGRVRPEKGTDVFVNAMLKLLPDLPGAVALVIGRAAKEHLGFEAGLKKQIAAAGLADRILFTGETPPEKLPALMRSLSLVMQLPRYEGYGMVPLEGMASAVPFVGSNAGYYSEFSAQGKTGTVVGQEAAEAAARAAQAILSDPVRYAVMAKTARMIAQDSFSAAAEAAGIEKVYQALRAEK